LTALSARTGIFDKHCNDLGRSIGAIAKGEAVV
jgi:hypothetical protein